MPFITTKCPSPSNEIDAITGLTKTVLCNKPLQIEKTYNLGSTVVHKTKCGHTLRYPKDKPIKINDTSPEFIQSLRGSKLFDYQVEGAKFALKNNVRCIISDEMGLGKTPQSLAVLACNPNELLPALFIVKSSLTIQWQHEGMNWLGEDFFTQIIEDSNDILIPGMKGYIISYDLIRRFRPKYDPKKKNDDGSNYYPPNKLKEFIKKIGIKTVILDEFHKLKNTESQRTKEVMDVIKNIPHIIGLSGTPIEKNALEYYPILNMCHPEMFPSLTNFKSVWIDQYYDGKSWKTGGLRNKERFKVITDKFIIRRQRKDVLKDLPAIQRQFSFHELSEIVERAYADELKKFTDAYESDSSQANTMNLLAYITKMRRLVGLSKIDPCIDKVMEFLGSNDDKKICIFIHHHDVHEILKLKLNSICKELEIEEPLSLTSNLDVTQRMNLIKQFKEDPRRRIMILSTLSSGEGLDGLQKVCDYIILLERQWNPSSEEQVEGRICRIGQESDKLTALYLVAIGTIDEFFSSLVEQKRSIVNSTLNGDDVHWNESDLMKELMFNLSMSGKKQWKLN